MILQYNDIGGKLTKSSFDQFKYIAEASEMGFPVGQWPKTIPTTIGNGNSFSLVRLFNEGALYKQDYGVLTITVFND